MCECSNFDRRNIFPFNSISTQQKYINQRPASLPLCRAIRRFNYLPPFKGYWAIRKMDEKKTGYDRMRSNDWGAATHVSVVFFLIFSLTRSFAIRPKTHNDYVIISIQKKNILNQNCDWHPQKSHEISCLSTGISNAIVYDLYSKPDWYDCIIKNCTYVQCV